MQAVLKRKTEEAEAARRKLRDLTELQARIRRDKQASQQGGGAGDPSGGSPRCTVVIASFIWAGCTRTSPIPNCVQGWMAVPEPAPAVTGMEDRYGPDAAAVCPSC